MAQVLKIERTFTPDENRWLEYAPLYNSWKNAVERLAHWYWITISQLIAFLPYWIYKFSQIGRQLLYHNKALILTTAICFKTFVFCCNCFYLIHFILISQTFIFYYQCTDCKANVVFFLFLSECFFVARYFIPNFTWISQYFHIDCTFNFLSDEFNKHVVPVILQVKTIWSC